MNDIARENIREKLVKAIESEGLTLKQAADILNVLSSYVSMIKNPSHWNKTPASAWEKALAWVNSGQTLREYAVKHGKVRPDPEPLKEPPQEPVLRVKPEALERRLKELAEKRKITAPLKVEKAIPSPGAEFTDTARLKVCLDVEINLLVNGQKVQLT
jgi:hypothetical protein